MADPACESCATIRAQLEQAQAALEGLVKVIDAAGLHQLSRGVELGPTVWFVKASDAMEYARAALSRLSAPTAKEEGK